MNIFMFRIVQTQISWDFYLRFNLLHFVTPKTFMDMTFNSAVAEHYDINFHFSDLV